MLQLKKKTHRLNSIQAYLKEGNVCDCISYTCACGLRCGNSDTAFLSMSVRQEVLLGQSMETVANN